MVADGTLRHVYKDGAARIDAFLEDYALYAEGLLALYGATWDERWYLAAREIAALAGPLPEAGFVLLHGEGGYTANLPLGVFLEEDVLLATGHDGAPLSPEHGAPVRAVAPRRYAWKSVKWLRGVEFLAADRPGYWEGYGYSDSADPWREERFRDEG